MEKVRVIVRWIAAQRIEGWNFATRVNTETPEAYFALCQTNIGGYTLLLQTLLDTTGIPCVTVQGNAKASTYVLGDDDTVGTALWNCVCVDNNWRIVNMGWMCQSVSRTSSQNDGKTQMDQREFGSCDEYHFLTDPHQAIFCQFPDNPKWQLLSHPLSKEQFYLACFCHPEFFKHGLDFSSHSECLLQSHLGRATIELHLPNGESKDLLYRFSRTGKQPDEKYGRKDLNNFVFTEQVKRLWRAEIQFPAEGHFTLEVFCKVPQDDICTQVCSYVINCPQRLINCKPHPENSRNEWGSGYDLEQLDLSPVSHTGGRVTVTDGEAEIVLDNPRGIRVIPHLESLEMPAENVVNCVVQRRDNKQIYLYVRVPQKGEYCLKLHTKGGNDVLRGICNYLVDATACLKFPAPFPHVNNGILGIAEEAQRAGFKAENHNDSLLRVSHKLVLDFSADFPVDLDWTLELHHQKGTEYFKNFSFLQFESRTKFSFNFRFPKTGTYFFSILGTKTAPESEKARHQPLANYIFEVQDADITWTPFPKVTREYHNRFYRLVQPLTGHLMSDRCYNFIIQAPNKATNLSISGQKEVVEIPNVARGVWRVDEIGDFSATDLWLQSNHGKLIEFQVKSPKDADIQTLVVAEAQEALQQEQDVLWEKQQKTEKETMRLENLMRQQHHAALLAQGLEDQEEKRREWEAEEQKKMRQEEAEQRDIERQRTREQIARKRQDISSLRKDLLEAADGRDIEPLREAIAAVTEMGCESDVKHAMDKAQDRLEFLEKRQRLGTKALKLDKKTLVELKSYAAPPEVVIHVFRVALLLLGHSEIATKKWQYVRKQLSPNTFLRQVQEYDASCLHPAIWARARDMCDQHSLPTVAAISAAAAAIYEWVNNTVSLRAPEVAPRKPSPATGREQKQILEDFPPAFIPAADFWDGI